MESPPLHDRVADAADTPSRAGSGPPDQPLRYALTNEVHARPLAVLPVAALVWLGVRRMRRLVTKARAAEVR